MSSIVALSATLADSRVRPSWGGSMNETATSAHGWTCPELAPDSRSVRRVAPARKGYLPHGEQPMAGIKIGRMAEEAWMRLTAEERVHGMKLWKLAALANFKFIPVQGTSPMGRTPDGLFVYPLIPALAGNKMGGRMDRFGRAYVEICVTSSGPRLRGIRLHDQFGHILLTVGDCNMVGATEGHSGLTTGIMDGPDELPEGWVYRKKDKTRDQAMTVFINACLKQRNLL